MIREALSSHAFAKGLRKVRDGFAMGSRKFAQGLDGFAQVRDGFAKVPRRVCTHSRRVYESSRQIRDGFAQIRKGLRRYVTQFSDTNARWCGVTSPVFVICTIILCVCLGADVTSRVVCAGGQCCTGHWCVGARSALALGVWGECQHWPYTLGASSTDGVE